MNAARLPTGQTHQCQKPVTPSPQAADLAIERRNDMIKARGWDISACSKTATVTLNGRHYCSLHAGEIVLHQALEMAA